MGGKSSKFEPQAPKTVVVFGATGSQGGSVVQAMRGDPNFVVKAVTRSKTGEKAQKLVEEGVEVVEANLDDVESLKEAVKDAFGVYAVTNYWEIMDGEKEFQQGKNIADACKEAGVKFMVYSGLEDVESQIKKPCPHFDYKAKVLAYIKEQGVPVCSVHYAGYMENLLSMLKARKTEEGEYIIDIPMEGHAMDFFPVSEAGECVHQIFIHHSKYAGKIVGLSSDKKTIAQIAEILAKHLDGKVFKAGEITCEQMAGAGFPGAAELAAMFEFYIKGKFSRDISLTKKLNPAISDFETWVKKNKEALEAVYE